MRTWISLFLMLVITPRSLLFFACLVMGALLAISSESWFGAWCGLELNLMSFIPFVRSKENCYLSEASLKYFLIQALGSAFIILGAVICLYNHNLIILLTMALLLKLGAAPFHFWFPQVIEGLTWAQGLILITIQKIGPLYLLIYTLYNWSTSFIAARATLSALVGAVGGINQSLLRKLLAFSSINHISWIMFRIFISENLWLTYFLFYSFISSSIIYLFHSQKCFFISQLIFFNKPGLDIIRFLSLLSLGGLPPFTGFIPKWIVVQEIIKQNQIFPFIILLSSSLLTLYYYLRIRIIFINVVYPNIKWNTKTNYINASPLLVVLNFFGLVVPALCLLT